jgi:hypothetical protein
MDERWIAEIWETQAFDHSALESLDLSVVYRGVPSDAGGPDYQDALLAGPDGSLIAGDVEFHVRSSDWTRHGHHLDPRYNGVALHVVWTSDTSTVRQDAQPIPTLELRTCCVLQPVQPALFQAPSLLPHSCVAAFRRCSTAELRARIIVGGMRRFDERAERFGVDMGILSPDQVVYTSLLEALGYASNRAAFRELAELAPIAWMRTLPADIRADALVAAAGLREELNSYTPARMAPDAWRLARIRPGNHPALRLRGIAEIINRVDGSLAGGISAAVRTANAPAELRAILVARDREHTFIGGGRADEIAVSAVLPFVAAAHPGDERARLLYSRYPSPPANRWTRFMVGLLSEGGHRFKPKTAPEHQGLHYLYHRFCRRERGGGCPVCDR